MGIKIQINSVDALERLIGNDNDVEIELRGSIVQEFTKRHLKSLVDDGMLYKASAAIQGEIEKEFFTSEKIGYNNRLVFKANVLDDFKEKIKSYSATILRETFDEMLGITLTKELIEERLNIAADDIIGRLSDENLSKRLDRMVDQRLKERLGLK